MINSNIPGLDPHVNCAEEASKSNQTAKGPTTLEGAREKRINKNKNKIYIAMEYKVTLSEAK